MKLHNTLTRQIEELKPINPEHIRMYSCGPTVYDDIHIGNLSSFIYADTLRRVVKASGYDVQHVMNFTDVDDKTIRRSAEKYPHESPEEALKILTKEYSDIFIRDMEAIGNDIADLDFIRATDSIEGMRQLIVDLYKDGYAYITDDGVYFSIQKYRDSGKQYGQLSEITEHSTATSRISNDEYDKDNVHDFALWKKQKAGEPAWEFELDNVDMTGRPGWHIECSAMSSLKLGTPFDIHTGGIDLIFPHHENEIAQNTAGNGASYAKLFFHNEHLLVEGKKMSKSLNNFYTIRDIQKRGYDPQDFRQLVLQSHYSTPSNFSWDNLDSAHNSLQHIQAWADLRFQDFQSEELAEFNKKARANILESAQNDLRIPDALTYLYGAIKQVEELGTDQASISEFVTFLDNLFGYQLSESKDITNKQKQTINDRQQARTAKDWTKSDQLRDDLLKQGISVRDTDHGPIWARI